MSQLLKSLGALRPLFGEALLSIRPAALNLHLSKIQTSHHSTSKQPLANPLTILDLRSAPLTSQRHFQWSTIDLATKFEKKDRAFETFWRGDINVREADNRRHIPLMAIAKAAIVACEDKSEAQGMRPEFEALGLQFLNEHLQKNVQNNTQGDVSKALYKAITNLKSHIFLGCGFENQQIAVFAMALLAVEKKAVTQIQAAQSTDEVKTAINHWRESLDKKYALSEQVCNLDTGVLATSRNSKALSNVKGIKKKTKAQKAHKSKHTQGKNKAQQDLSQLPVGSTSDNQREGVKQSMSCQLMSVLACLDADNFEDLAAFKSEAVGFIKNLRDSYSTDISKARNDTIRVWQNNTWPNIQKQMLQLIDTPDLTEFQNVLQTIVQAEEKFSAIVDTQLQAQGFAKNSARFLTEITPLHEYSLRQSVMLAFQTMIEEPRDTQELAFELAAAGNY